MNDINIIMDLVEKKEFSLARKILAKSALSNAEFYYSLDNFSAERTKNKMGVRDYEAHIGNDDEDNDDEDNDDETLAEYYEKDQKYYKNVFKFVSSLKNPDWAAYVKALPEHCLIDFFSQAKKSGLDFFAKTYHNSEPEFYQILNNLASKKNSTYLDRGHHYYIDFFLKEQPAEKIEEAFISDHYKSLLKFIEYQPIYISDRHVSTLISLLNTSQVQQSQNYHHLFSTYNAFSNKLYSANWHQFSTFMKDNKDFISSYEDIIYSNYIATQLVEKANDSDISKELYNFASNLVNEQKFQTSLPSITERKNNDELFIASCLEHGRINCSLKSNSYQLFKTFLNNNSLAIDKLNMIDKPLISFSFYERFLSKNIISFDIIKNTPKIEQINYLQNIIDEANYLVSLGIQPTLRGHTKKQFTDSFEKILSSSKNGQTDAELTEFCNRLNLPPSYLKPIVEFLDKRYHYALHQNNNPEEQLAETKLKDSWNLLISQFIEPSDNLSNHTKPKI